MSECPICLQSFSRRDAMLRHRRNVHDQGSDESTSPPFCWGPDRQMKFEHPFTMVVSGPSGSGKTQWTKQLLLSSLIQSSPQRIIWCYGQWQPLYQDLRRAFPNIQFVNGIPDELNDDGFLRTQERNLIVLDDLMTEAKCDQRIADLFTKGRHHRNVSVVYLTQNLFPQGKACRDIALNTQYMVLFNNPIDRQQVATLAKRIYPSNSARFMNQYNQAVQRPYGYLVVDLKSCTPEHSRLRSDIFRIKRSYTISDTESKADEACESSHKRLKYTRDWDSEDDGSSTSGSEPSVKDLKAVESYLNETIDDKDDTDDEAASEDNDKFLRNLIVHRVNMEYNPLIIQKSQHYIEKGDSTYVAECKAFNDMLLDIRGRARECLSDVIEWLCLIDKSVLYQSILDTARRLRDSSELPLHMAIKEAVCMHKPQLGAVLVPEKDVDDVKASM